MRNGFLSPADMADIYLTRLGWRYALVHVDRKLQDFFKAKKTSEYWTDVRKAIVDLSKGAH